MDQEESLMILIEQLRAARSLLGWSQTELAKRAGLSLPTVKRVEREDGDGPNVSEEARNKLRVTLEKAGVVFIAENGGGAGVRLRKPKR
ncbi:MAG TPA: helix-turn-helix transcriptional regulator [Bradyrhizobium sp.]|jgi:transcriptional regulator with XRE-family HTH domain|uniref:helix-turn-helix domain-containing protein n=1 Tax=Bradyrhizobium sp. TaxID=376 RepID=UPI002CAAA47C|nr:helix-turn-helix transcriptional regulator [Bradyrhizobium sp.]HXB77010.1 helix-turn-helix transcriptional regulator [Bradyrhizobium sp.]